MHRHQLLRTPAPSRHSMPAPSNALEAQPEAVFLLLAACAPWLKRGLNEAVELLTPLFSVCLRLPHRLYLS